QFVASSLGVRCGFCHVEGDFSKDTKRTKLTARKMMRMEFAIDRANFGGRPEVTCFTCHRGSSHPVGVPVISAVAMSPAPGGGMARGMNSGPSAGEILTKYADALGGPSAIQKISTRVEKGTVIFGGRQFPIEIYAQAPDERVSIMHSPRGESITGTNGATGWMTGMDGRLRVMTGDDLAAARLDAEFDLALDLKQLYPHLREGRPEKVDGNEATVLLGFTRGQPPVKLYFDQQSGLLLRMETYSETPLGPNPTQVNYADYREADGVKVPFQWTIARPGGSFTIKVNSIRQGVPIDQSKFAPPSGSASPGQ
ncbi:MAG: photosynthetic reaction center cytochrome c subunit family protein, partial [Terriglobia bacterium]